MIRVLIAEDSAVTREYLRWLIDDAEGLEVAGVANDGEEAVELAERLQPDVILMDVHMPQMDGFQATRLIMERHPTPIVMATASSSKAETRGALRGARRGRAAPARQAARALGSGPRRGGRRAAARRSS